MIWEKASKIDQLISPNCLLILYGTNQLLDSIYLPEILNTEEIGYAEKLHDQTQKKTWLCSRAYIKLTLASLMNLKPLDLQFKKNHFGKPYVQIPNLYFNLSHTKNALLISYNYKGRVGVDLEFLTGSESIQLLIDYAFSDHEKAYCLGGEDRVRFLEIWTKKEAFFKAAGIGLINKLNTFSVVGKSDNPLEHFKLNHESFFCPGNETGSIVYKGTNPIRFVSLQTF